MQDRLGLREPIQPRASLMEETRRVRLRETPHLISEEWYKGCQSVFSFGEELPHNGSLRIQCCPKENWD